MNCTRLRFRIAVLALTTVLLTATDHVTTAEDRVELKAATWEQLTEYIGRYKGKVVVVDLWSTSCIPCMREFPNLVKLQKKFGDSIVCVSFNCDYVGIKSKPPETYHDRVLKFLKKQNATFLNVLCKTPSDELFDKIDLGSIPAVYVYGTDGKLANRFDNDEGKYGDEFTYEKHVIPMVEKLIAK